MTAHRVVSQGRDPRAPLIEADLDDGIVVVVDDCIRVADAKPVRLGGRAHRACVARGAKLVALTLEQKRFTCEPGDRIGAHFLVSFQTLVFDIGNCSITRLEIPTKHETVVAISPDGTVLATLYPEHALWELPGGARVATLEPSGLVLEVAAFDRLGQRFAALFDGNPNPLAELNDQTPWETELRVWRCDGSMLFAERGAYQPVEYLGFTADGSEVVALNRNREPVLAWDTESGQRRDARTTPAFVERKTRRGLAEPGRNVGLMVLDDGGVEVTDPVVPVGLSIPETIDAQYPFALCRAADVGAALAWPGRSGAQPEVVRWHVGSGRPMDPLRPPGGAALTSLALSQDGRWAAAGCADWSVYVWNMGSGELHATLRAHEATVDGVGFSGDELYSRARDGAVLAWDLSS